MINIGLTARPTMEENCRKSLVKYSSITRCRSGFSCCGPRLLNTLPLKQHSRTYACSPIRSVPRPLPLHQRILNRFVLNPFFQLQDFVAAATTVKATLNRRPLPTIPEAHQPAEVAKIYEEALAQYDVKPYPGGLVLFLTDRHPAVSPSLGRMGKGCARQ